MLLFFLQCNCLNGPSMLVCVCVCYSCLAFILVHTLRAAWKLLKFYDHISGRITIAISHRPIVPSSSPLPATISSRFSGKIMLLQLAWGKRDVAAHWAAQAVQLRGDSAAQQYIKFISRNYDYFVRSLLRVFLISISHFPLLCVSSPPALSPALSLLISLAAPASPAAAVDPCAF